jgi:Terminase large subunit, T4likevirus-type, N-terminal
VSKQRRQDALPPTRTPQAVPVTPMGATSPLNLGSREPAYRLVPKHTTSRGAEAVNLMRRAGYTLDDWQIDVLEAALGLYKGRWAAPEVCVLAPRQNGKTEAAIAAALYVATSGPKKLVIVSSHETKTNEEVFLRMREVVETPAFDAFAPRAYVANGREGISLNNGSRIKFIARSKHQGRGFSADLIIIDEAFVLSEGSWSSLKPSLSAAKQPQIWLLSSAPHPDSDVLRRYCLRGRAGTDADLAYFEWCAPLDAAPDGFEAWAGSNPALGRRIAVETVASELKALDPEAFARERLGIWREDETPSPFPPGSWDALSYAGHLEVDGTPCLAVDVTPARDHSTIAVAANTDAGRPLVEVVERQRGTSWVVPKLQEVLERYRGAKVIVDRSAWAASLAEDIRAADIAVHETNAAEVSTAAGQFLEATLEQKFFHRGDPRLTSAVEGSRQRPIGERWGWDRKLPTVDVSPLVAASLALWGLRTFKPATQYFWWPTTPEERAQQVDPTGWVIKQGAVPPSEIGAMLNDV